MIQTINPYNSTARTAEIMSRYRPIAPKPENTPTDSSISDHLDNNNTVSNLPQSIRKSPYLRNVWANLQARPTRTRKRGRTAAFAPPPLKRNRACPQGLSQPYDLTNYSSPAKNLVMHGFAHANTNGLMVPPQISIVPLNCGLDAAVTTLAECVALPQLLQPRAKGGIDLNLAAGEQEPQELDFMPQLKEPVKPVGVISPRPVRPVGSSVIVRSITSDDVAVIEKGSETAEEVEKEVEDEKLPAIVSDSSNRVRLANSAYKEMVGQPECCWLDSVAPCSRRIGGEVLLRFGDGSDPNMGRSFSCRVRIEWQSDGKERRCVDAFCRVVKLACDAKDYQYLWMFHAAAGDDGASKSVGSDDRN